MAADGGGLVLSNAEFCRYLSNADPARFSTQRLHDELSKPDVLRRLRLNVRYYAEESPSATPANDKRELSQVRYIADKLDVPYGVCLSLFGQFMNLRASEAEPEFDVFLQFYLHERTHLLMLLSLLLQAAGDAGSPYCPVARVILPQVPDLFDSIITSYRALSAGDIPKQLSAEHITYWADGIVDQQASCLQVIACYLFAFKESPTQQQVESLLNLFQSQDTSPLYTLLSSDGRRSCRCITSLWTLLFTQTMHLRSLHSALSDPSNRRQPTIGSLPADASLFDALPATAGEYGPIFLSFAVYLCLSYQLGNGDVSELQQGTLRYLSQAMRLDAFPGLAHAIRELDAHPLLDASSLLARETYHDLLTAVCVSNIFNVLYSLDGFFDRMLAPLYTLLLERNPELSERMWSEIDAAIANASDLRSFPLFANMYHRFQTALTMPLQSSYHKEMAPFLSLLRVMSSSPMSVAHAASVLEQTIPGGFAAMQDVFARAVRALSAGDTNESTFVSEFARCALEMISHAGNDGSLNLSVSFIESVLVLLHYVAEHVVQSRAVDPLLVEVCLGLLCHAPRCDAEFARLLQRYSLPLLAHKFLYNVDLPRCSYSCTAKIIRVIDRILLESDTDLHFPIDDYAPLASRLMDFVCNDVFVCYCGWRFAEDVGRWTLGESLLTLFVTVLSSDDLLARLTLRGQVGYGIGVRLCNESLMQRSLIHPIINDRLFLEFGQPKRVKDVVSTQVALAFRALQLLLNIRVEWNHRPGVDPLNESLLDLFFKSGLDSARVLRQISAYLELPEYTWSRHSIVTLTRLSVLSSLAGPAVHEISAIAGLIGQAKVHELRVQCRRLLSLQNATFQSCVLELLSATLQFQPGMAERLFGFSAANLEGTDSAAVSQREGVWAPLRELLLTSNGDLLVLESVLQVVQHLWESATEYRSIATVVDFLLERHGDELWGATAAPTLALVNPIPSAAEAPRLRLAGVRSASCVFRTITCELRYTDNKSKSLTSSNILPRVLKSASQWLYQFLPTSEEWASFDDETSSAFIACITNWKLFIEATLLYKCVPADFPSSDYVTRLTTHSLALEGIPLPVIRDCAQLLLAVSYHCADVAPPWDTLVRALELHSSSYLQCLALGDNPAVQPTTLAYAAVCDGLLSEFAVRLPRGSDHHMAALRIACNLTERSQHAAWYRYIPTFVVGLPPTVSLADIPALRSALSAMMHWAGQSEPTGAEQVRLRTLLMTSIAVAHHSRGSELLIELGVLPRFSNSWLRNVDPLSSAGGGGGGGRTHEVWCLLLDLVVALLRWSSREGGTERLFQRHVVEFAVVFRRTLLVGIRIPLIAENLEEVHRSLRVISAIGSSPKRFRELPASIENDLRYYSRNTTVAATQALVSGSFRDSSSAECEMLLRIVATGLMYLRIQPAQRTPDLFVFDLTSRSDGADKGAPPLTFLVDLVDFCTTEKHLPLRDAKLPRLVLEHALCILIERVLYCTRHSPTPAVIPQDVLQEIVRIRRAIETLAGASEPDDDRLAIERVTDSLRLLEDTVRTAVRAPQLPSSNGALLPPSFSFTHVPMLGTNVRY